MRVLLALDSDEAGQRATEAHAEAIADFTVSWGVPRGSGPTAQALAAAQNARDDAARHWAAMDEACATNASDTLIQARNEAEILLEVIGSHITDLYKSLFKDRDWERCESAEEFQELLRPKPKQPYDATRIDWEGIKARVDLVDWLANVTGNDFVRRGNSYKSTCPLPAHKDDTASFFVYPEQRNYYCYGCHKWGDIFDMAKELNIDVRSL